LEIAKALCGYRNICIKIGNDLGNLSLRKFAWRREIDVGRRPATPIHEVHERTALEQQARSQSWNRTNRMKNYLDELASPIFMQIRPSRLYPCLKRDSGCGRHIYLKVD
jgi:hypothetical protein